jgi:hypothetical protein
MVRRTFQATIDLKAANRRFEPFFNNKARRFIQAAPFDANRFLPI